MVPKAQQGPTRPHRAQQLILAALSLGALCFIRDFAVSVNRRPPLACGSERVWSNSKPGKRSRVSGYAQTAMFSSLVRPVWVLSMRFDARTASLNCHLKRVRAVCKHSLRLARLFVQATQVLGCDALGVRSRQLGLKLHLPAACFARLARLG